MSRKLAIGMIGLDSSRALAFAELLKGPDAQVLPCRADLVMACPGPESRSPHDAERSSAHARQLEERWGVSLTDRPEEVADKCDLLMLLSAGARDRGVCFDQVVDCAKPMYLEKSLAETSSAAQAMVDRADRSGSALFSASSVRFSAGWCHIMKSAGVDGSILGVDLFGPMPLHETLPTPLWYGVHLADLAINALGVGWSGLERFNLDHGEVSVVKWPGGKVANLRGCHEGPRRYGATVHLHNLVAHHDLRYDPRGCNAGLLKTILEVLTTGEQDMDEAARMVEVVRLTESMAYSDSHLCKERT